MPWCVPQTFFAYEDEAALQSWDKHGLTAENADQMIQIIVLPDSLTLVISEESKAKTRAIVAQIVEAVEHGRTPS